MIAEYRDVTLHAVLYSGRARFHAALDRRLLGFWRCRLDVRSADGGLLLSGLVAVAAGARA